MRKFTQFCEAVVPVFY